MQCECAACETSSGDASDIFLFFFCSGRQGQGGGVRGKGGGLFFFYPDLPFRAFFDFLAFFDARNFLAVFERFPLSPRDLRGSAERKILAFWVVFLAFPKKARKGRSGHLEIEKGGGFRREEAGKGSQGLGVYLRGGGGLNINFGEGPKFPPIRRLRVEKLTRSSSQGVLSRALFASKNARFASSSSS